MDVDKRAAQLASFSLIMKARSVNNRFFNDQFYETPHVYELQDSKVLKELEYRKQLKDLNLLDDEEIKLITYLVDTFENGKTIGSLLKVKPIDFTCLDGALEKVSKGTVTNLFNIDFLNSGMKRLKELSRLAKVLSAKYDVMITNPPYIGPSSMEAPVKDYAAKNYPNTLIMLNDELFSSEEWSQIAAIKDKHVFKVPMGMAAWNRYSIEIALMIPWTASVIYPEYYSFDAVQETIAFYKEFSGIELTEEQASYIIEGLTPNGEKEIASR